MTEDLTRIPARQLALALSSYRRSLLVGSLPEDKKADFRERVSLIRSEMDRRGLIVSRLP